MADHLEIPNNTPPADTAIRATPPAKLDTAFQIAPSIQNTAPDGAAELRRLDEEWQAEQSKHTVLYGKRAHLPSMARTVASAFSGLLIALSGGALLVLDGMVLMGWRQLPTTNLLIALFFFSVGLGLPIYHLYRYRLYEQARQDYLRRRAEVLARLP